MKPKWIPKESFEGFSATCLFVGNLSVINLHRKYFREMFLSLSLNCLMCRIIQKNLAFREYCSDVCQSKKHLYSRFLDSECLGGNLAELINDCEAPGLGKGDAIVVG